MCKPTCAVCSPPKPKVKMPWDYDTAHTRTIGGRKVLRGSEAHAQDIMARHDIATKHNTLGRCIICGRSAVPGTRYCGGDRGCQSGA